MDSIGLSRNAVEALSDALRFEVGGVRRRCGDVGVERPVLLYLVQAAAAVSPNSVTITTHSTCPTTAARTAGIVSA